MIIELLYFQISPEERTAWLAKDAAVWTSFLARQPGFLRKEAWLTAENSPELCLVIWWQSLEAMQAIPREQLDAVDRAMGDGRYAPTRVEIKQVVAVDRH